MTNDQIPAAFIQSVVRVQVRQLVRTGGVRPRDAEDAEADLIVEILEILKKQPGYDAKRGSVEGFCIQIAVTRRIDLLRRAKAKKRWHTTQQLGNEDVAKDVRLGPPTNQQENLERSLDVQQIIEGLPAAEAAICRALQTLVCKPLAEELDIPRSTLRGRLKRTRDCFVRGGYGDFGIRAATPRAKFVDREGASMHSEPKPGRGSRRVTFKPGIDLREVKAVAQDATDIAAILHGEAAVRLGSCFSLDSNTGVATFETTAQAASDFAKTFLALAEAEFGRDSFNVEAQ